MPKIIPIRELRDTTMTSELCHNLALYDWKLKELSVGCFP